MSGQSFGGRLLFCIARSHRRAWSMLLKAVKRTPFKSLLSAERTMLSKVVDSRRRW